MNTNDKTLADVQPGGRVRLGDQAERAPWRSMDTCPRDGTVVRLRWGEDHVSPGWWSAPVSPVQNDDGTWPSDTGGFPWAFIDFNNGSAFVNHAVDTEYGPTHWAPYAALSAQPSPGGQRDDSPMAKMAAALRGKAEAERAAFDQRVKSGEWGPMPDNPDVLELPPLPEEVDSVRCMIRGEKGFAEPCDYYFTSKQMRDYARTALAALQPVGEPFAYGSSAGHQPIPASIYYPDNAACRELYDIPLYAAPPAQQPAQVYLDGLDRALGEAIDQRDRYHEVADDLAGHIAAITGVDIGEHSSANCPWQNAIEAAEEYKPAQAVDLVAAIKAAFPLLTDYGLHHSQCCAYKLIDERHRLHNFIDSLAVGNG